ncbi:MAG: S9 family peptidase [Sphingomonadales bacterium]|nr:S9 family peptidase [Sphingomonadales bacterium]
MKTITLVLGILGFGIAGALASDAAKRPMTIDDELNLVRVGDAVLSPDGRQVFYSLSTLNWAENKYDTKYYMAASDGSRTVEYIGEGGGSDFRFSPTGAYLAFIREPEEEDAEEGATSQLFIMSTAGGEAMPLTRHRGNIVDFKWLADGSGIVFVAEEMGTEEGERERRLGADAIFIDEAPNGKAAARFTNFWSIGLGDKTARRITDEELVVEGFDISPDGVRIVFTARPDTRTNYIWEAELYLAEVSDGEVRQLTDNDAPESDPLWSPDGKRIAYRAPSDQDLDLRVGHFWVMEPTTDAVRRLDGQRTGELFEGTIAWSPDGKYLLYSEVHGTNTNLYRLNVRTDKAEALTSMTGTLGAQSFSRDGKRMAYFYENFTTPRDLYVSGLKGRNAVRITDANPWVREQLQLSEGEFLRWTSKGDIEIEGVFYPALNAGAGKSPMILNIHGGPAGVIINRFRADFQVLAGQGYAVLGPNFRGSTGYGDALLRGLMGEVGDGEFVDNMTGVDHAIETRNIDPERLGVRGWSWGGVSSSYTVTQTDRFKAASIGAMVGNWAAETGPGFNYDVAFWYIGGTPWDNPEEWAKRSSITHVKNVTTPSIIFHGGKDTTSSVGQSLMFFTALRDIGKAPVRYIKFPREGHGVREPRHRRLLSIEEMKWFKKHIEGVDWTPPVRAKKVGEAVE